MSVVALSRRSDDLGAVLDVDFRGFNQSHFISLADPDETVQPLLSSLIVEYLTENFIISFWLLHKLLLMSRRLAQ